MCQYILLYMLVGLWLTCSYLCCRSAPQTSVVVQPAPIANPFGTLPAMPQMSIGRTGTSPSIQYGISSMPVMWFILILCIFALKFWFVPVAYFALLIINTTLMSHFLRFWCEWNWEETSCVTMGWWWLPNRLLTSLLLLEYHPYWLLDTSLKGGLGCLQGNIILKMMLQRWDIYALMNLIRNFKMSGYEKALRPTPTIKGMIGFLGSSKFKSQWRENVYSYPETKVWLWNCFNVSYLQ